MDMDNMPYKVACRGAIRLSGYDGSFPMVVREDEHIVRSGKFLKLGIVVRLYCLREALSLIYATSQN